jgi:hypothetical protein
MNDITCHHRDLIRKHEYSIGTYSFIADVSNLDLKVVLKDPFFVLFCSLVLVVVLEFELRALHLLGRHFTT